MIFHNFIIYIYIYIYIHESHSLNIGIKKKIIFSELLEIGLKQKLFKSRTNICVEAIQNRSSTGKNRGMSTNFCWLRSANHVKFPEECLMCTEKHVLGEKMFTNRLNYL